MANILKNIAASFLLLLVTIVFVASAQTGQPWSPSKEELAVMSLKSALIINISLLIAISLLIFLVFRAFQA